MGLEFDCPGHDQKHRVAIWFENPGDGGPPMGLPGQGNAGLYWLAVCCDLDWLTVIPRNGCGGQAIVLRGHWTGWLVDGHLTDFKISGISW